MPARVAEDPGEQKPRRGQTTGVPRLGSLPPARGGNTGISPSLPLHLLPPPDKELIKPSFLAPLKTLAFMNLRTWVITL